MELAMRWQVTGGRCSGSV